MNVRGIPDPAPPNTTRFTTTLSAWQVINRYFAAALADAEGLTGLVESESLRREQRAWLATGDLTRVTALQALMWATNHASSAEPGDRAAALEDRRALLGWLRAQGYASVQDG